MKTTAITLGALLAVIAVFGYFMTFPAYQSWDTLQRQVLAVDHDLSVAKDRRNQSKQIQAEATTIHDKASTAKQLFPTTEDRESFISQYDALATQHSVTLSVLNFTTSDTPKKSKKSTAGETLTFTSTLSGDYISVRDVLIQLQRMPRYVSLSNVTIVIRDNGVIATVDGAIYTLTEPKIPDKLNVKPTVWSYIDERANRALPDPVGLQTTGRQNPFTSY